MTLFSFSRGLVKEEHLVNLLITTDKALFSSKKCYLSYFSTKTYVVGTH